MKITNGRIKIRPINEKSYVHLKPHFQVNTAGNKK